MHRHLQLLAFAAESLVRNRVRTLASMACLAAVLVPFTVASSLSAGVRQVAEAQVAAGPDILVTGEEYGFPAAVDVALAGRVAALPGVLHVAPRAIGRVELDGRVATVLGMDPVDGQPFPGALEAGRAPRPGTLEAVVGTRLARELGTGVGGHLVVETGQAVRVLGVVGLFRPEAPMAAASLIWTSLHGASSLFGASGKVTDLAVRVRPGYVGGVAEAIVRMGAGLRVQTASLVRRYVHGGMAERDGIFGVLWSLLAAAAVPVVVVTSGIGLGERRREVALLRATGWQTVEVVEAVFFENLLLGLSASALSFLVAALWVRGLNGAGIARLFLGEIGVVPPFPVPALLWPGPLLLTAALAVAICLVGSLPAAWRAAAAAPAEALR